MSSSNMSGAFEPTDIDCKACQYDEHGHITTMCKPCEVEADAILHAWIGLRRLANFGPEGSA